MKTRWILLILTVLFVAAIESHIIELAQLRRTLQQARGTWLLAALLVQAVYYLVFTGTYLAAFRAVDINARFRDLLPLTLGSMFVNSVVPAGGAGGAALFVEDLARRGKSPAAAATGVLLQLIADLCAFAVLLVPGLVYLSTQHALKAYEIGAAGVLLLMIGGLASMLLLGIWRQTWLHRLFDWSQRTANWLFGRVRRSLTLADDWAQKNAEAFGQASTAAADHPARLMLTIGIALIAHLLDLASLYLVFAAFHHPVSVGVLIAGYGVGILFWVVSITPQGIGVVEGMMALTFASLGVPGGVAAMAALTFRFLTFWLPMLLGFLAVQRIRTFGTNRRTLTETWGVRIAAILVTLMGVVNVLSAVTPSLAKRLAMIENISPLEVQRGGHLTAALAGFALIMLARNLARRKYVAWLLTMAVLAISAASHLIKGLDYEEASLATALMLLLWFMRAHFHARSDRPSVQQGLRVLVGALLFTLAYGVTGFFLLDRHYSVHFGLWTALQQTVVMFTQFYDPGLVPLTRFGRFFADSIYIVGAATLGYAGLMLLRPVFLREPATPAERQRARQVVEAYGRSSLARYLLFEDKRYFFTPGGSVIGYAQAGRTAITLGDPVGPEADLAATIEAFTAFCQRNDWLPVFYQTLPDTVDTYKAAGFVTLPIGEEGIVNLATFTLEGKEGKPLRAPINKITRLGYTFVIHRPPIEQALLEELRSISDEWLTSMHGSEKRFSVGWFADDYIRGSPIAAVHSPEGWVTAFANLVTEFQRNEISIDLMRHRQRIENGTMEFLFVSMFQWARAQGYQSFNLGLSALSGVGAQSDDAAIERLLHFIYEHINQFYNFKGLHAFKEKFQPEWSRRYLVYPSQANLGQAFLALVEADSGRGPLLLRGIGRR